MLKKIKDHENYYVDTEGNVYRMLQPHWKKDTKRTYKQIALSEKGNVKSHLIHHLVAETFIPNPNNYNSIHHINGDRLDNRVENLEWIDESDHRALHVINGEDRVHNFIECELYVDDEFINSFKSIAEASRFATNNFGARYYQLVRNKTWKNIKIVKKSVTTIREE